MWFKRKEKQPEKEKIRVLVKPEDMVIGEIYFPFSDIKIKDCGRLIEMDGEYAIMQPIIQEFIVLPFGMKDIYNTNTKNGWPLYVEVDKETYEEEKAK